MLQHYAGRCLILDWLTSVQREMDLKLFVSYSLLIERLLQLKLDGYKKNYYNVFQLFEYVEYQHIYHVFHAWTKC